jgi:hypothetical protein
MLAGACARLATAQDIPFEVSPAQQVDTNVAPVVDQIVYPGLPFSAQDVPISPAPAATLDLSQDNFVPDCAGAVSSSNIVTMINRRFSVHRKSDFGLLTNMSLFNFWKQSTNTGSYFLNVYDPMIVFDPTVRRFIATSANDNDKTNAGFLIGVSMTEDPLGPWNMRWVKADNGNGSWGDQPHIGFNDRYIVISVNMFLNAGSISGVDHVSKLFVFDKTNMYAGNYAAPATRLTVSTNAILFRSVWPAATYDSNATNLFLVQNQNGNQHGSGYLSFWNLSGSPSNPTLNLEQQPRVLERTWATLPPGEGDDEDALTNFAPQLGITNGTYKVQLMDARMHSVIQKNGYIYAAQMIFIPADNPTRSIIQYFKISPEGQIVSRGEIDDGSSFYGFPNISVNDFGDILIGYAKFGSNIYPSAAYRVKNCYDGRFGTEQVFAEGQDFFVRFDNNDRNRWGDYTTSVVDPSNGRDFWTLGEYSKPHNTNALIQSSGVYGLRWAKVELYQSPNDSFANAESLTGSTGTNHCELARHTMEPGEPAPFGSSDGSVWFSWTAPVSGQVTFDSGSPKVALAAYTGTGVASLTEVARSDPPSRLNLPLKANFTAVGGTTYRIALSAAQGFKFTTDMTWNQPAAPYFVLHPNSEKATNEVVNGYSLTLKSIALGNPAPSFQWKRNGLNITGANSTNYTISSMSSGDEGAYTLFATNSVGSATSQSAYVKFFAEGSQPLEQPAWTNGVFQVPFNHVSGYWYVIYGTTNYVDWTPIQTNQVPFTFSDSTATNFPYKFYRAEFLP